MAEERMALPDALRKGEEPAEDPLRQIVRWAVQELMEAEVAAQIGAGRYERTDERSTQRNGYRPTRGTRGWARWSCRFPNYGRGATCRAGWSRGGGPSRRWWQSSRKRTCRA